MLLRGQLLTPLVERPGALLVRTGRIAAVLPVDAPAAAARTIAIDDGWIAPGFIDLQVNGALGYDLGEEPAALAAVAGWLPRTGVTAFLPTVITAPLDQLRMALAGLGAQMAAPVPGAQPLGIHLEGPYLNPDYCGAHAADCLRPIDLAELAGLCAAGPVRLVTLAPELSGGLAAVAWLRQQGIVVAAGHSGASLDEARAAIAAGVTVGTHLFNAMAPLHHRAPGLVGALLTAAAPARGRPGARASLLADGVHVDPTLLALAYRARGAAGLALVTDAMAGLGLGDGDERLAGRAVQVRGGVARLADGTLAGGVVPMDGIIRTMRAACGCSIAAAVRMATLTPAAVLGLPDRGRLVAGARADLVVLDSELRVQRTIIGGEVVWDAADAGPAGTIRA
ncbi:MAG: N-acetylglucosamine-6-phosphate deacetylase [Chloroflexi bacterium]|nr:N-acetylglucosamine-6-phosphate deacetylase [Chloroflexota bacterium]